MSTVNYHDHWRYFKVHLMHSFNDLTIKKFLMNNQHLRIISNYGLMMFYRNIDLIQMS